MRSVFSPESQVRAELTCAGQADWSESFTKKKTAGVSDMTLLSTISNEAVNDNLKKRFECVEVRLCCFTGSLMRAQERRDLCERLRIPISQGT